MGKPSFAGRSFVGGSAGSTGEGDTRTPDPSTGREAVTLDQCPHLAGRYRTPDGSYNALDDPDMGMAGSRFGRPPHPPRR